MNCQNCHELIEPGAAFCGNCGYPVQTTTPTAAPTPPAAIDQNTPPTEPVVPEQQPVVPTIPQTSAVTPLPPTPVTSTNNNGGALPQVPANKPAVPRYALGTPNQHAGETPAVLSVIAGVIGIVGAGFLIPIIGFAFGVAGLCAGTVSRRMVRRRLTLLGLIFASLAIVAGFASLVYNTEHDKNATPSAQTGQSDASSKVLSKLTTPCYSFNLINQYNISNGSGSCNTTVFNGQSFTSSSEFYKIVATKGGTVDPGSFTSLAKQAIDSDVKTNLPGFVVSSEGPSSFAGSLAYSVYAVDKSQQDAVIEIAVLHQSKGGDNIFDIVHAVSSSSNTNLQALEAQWQWK